MKEESESEEKVRHTKHKIRHIQLIQRPLLNRGEFRPGVCFGDADAGCEQGLEGEEEEGEVGCWGC